MMYTEVKQEGNMEGVQCGAERRGMGSGSNWREKGHIRGGSELFNIVLVELIST